MSKKNEEIAEFEELEFEVNRKIFKQGYRHKLGNKLIKINDFIVDEDNQTLRSKKCIVFKGEVNERNGLVDYKEHFSSDTHLKGLNKNDAYLLYVAGVIKVTKEQANDLCAYHKQLIKEND